MARISSSRGTQKINLWREVSFSGLCDPSDMILPIAVELPLNGTASTLHLVREEAHGLGLNLSKLCKTGLQDRHWRQSE